MLLFTKGTARYTSTLAATPRWHLSLVLFNTSTQSRPHPTAFHLPCGQQFLTTMMSLTPSRSISTGQQGCICMHSHHASECIWNGYMANLHDGIVIARPWWLCCLIMYVLCTGSYVSIWLIRLSVQDWYFCTPSCTLLYFHSVSVISGHSDISICTYSCMS